FDPCPLNVKADIFAHPATPRQAGVGLTIQTRHTQFEESALGKVGIRRGTFDLFLALPTVMFPGKPPVNIGTTSTTNRKFNVGHREAPHGENARDLGFLPASVRQQWSIDRFLSGKIYCKHGNTLVSPALSDDVFSTFRFADHRSRECQHAGPDGYYTPPCPGERQILTSRFESRARQVYVGQKNTIPWLGGPVEFWEFRVTDAAACYRVDRWLTVEPMSIRSEKLEALLSNTTSYIATVAKTENYMAEGCVAPIPSPIHTAKTWDEALLGSIETPRQAYQACDLYGAKCRLAAY
ncbi:hypothetical protein BaRGS_00032541, partial [Batillaria attramentaria]